MKQVQLVLESYKPEKYETGLLAYNYWEKKVGVFLGFWDEHDKKRYISERSNKSIVKPYLVSVDDKIEKGNSFYHIHTMQVLKCAGIPNEDAIYANGVPYPKSECRKVIATPEEIGWFITEHLRDARRDNLVSYMQTILDGGGKCWIEMDEVPDIQSWKESTNQCDIVSVPKIMDGKVLIHLTEETA